MKKDRLFFLGDLHGNWKLIKYYVKTYGITNAYIIQVGDFGIGFKKEAVDEEYLEFINSKLEQFNVTLLVIRGNHDDPKPFTNNKKLSNIEFLPDYTIRNLCGKNILFVGGAVSVDRNHRRMNQLGWFEGEKFVLDEERLYGAKDIDIVVTHSAPSFAFPIGFNQFVYDYAKEDDLLLKDMEVERNNLTKMYDILEMKNEISHWYYGHFHKSIVDRFKHTEFRLLGIGELKELMV